MVCSLIVAGFLKGIIGVGIPVVALPLLSLFIDVKSAAMLSMPLILSNLPQALEGGKTGWCLVQLMPVILGMIPGLFLGVRVLLAVDANVAEIIAGLVLMGVGGVTLLAPKPQLQSRLVFRRLAAIAYTEVARPERFELPTPKFVVWCSIQLSYGRLLRIAREMLPDRPRPAGSGPIPIGFGPHWQVCDLRGSPGLGLLADGLRGC